MHKKGIRRVAWVENPTNLQAVLNVGFINPRFIKATAKPSNIRLKRAVQMIFQTA